MVAVRNEIRFRLNDRTMVLDAVAPDATLLDHLRLDQQLRGTKEGCNEGDCGACTVLIGRVRDGTLRYEPVNACIRLLPSVDRCHVVTVEALKRPDGTLHPVQQALVEHHASQCGFCTPGFVMTLYALWLNDPARSDRTILSALQGNLCRCTGYRPIVEAARAMAGFGAATDDPLIDNRGAIQAQLASWDDGARVELAKGGKRAILPSSVDDLAAVRLAEPDATIVAGATDVGLWVTKFLKDISPAVFVGHLDALQQLERRDDHIVIGAGASYSDAATLLLDEYPHLRELWDRIGGWQVRSAGTVGGNIANGSPIGDTPPALIALGATVTLRRGEQRRTLPLEDFFLAYGRQDREPGDLVEALTIPRAQPDRLYRAYKVSKRRDEDISSICAAFTLALDGETVTDARLAFGGMAATPKRARQAEAELIGKRWTATTALEAGNALAKDFTPISDWRASATYRATAARNLLRRFHLETTEGAAAVRLAEAS